jgi:integrase
MKRRAERSIVPVVRRKITNDVVPPHLAWFQRSHEVKELAKQMRGDCRRSANVSLAAARERADEIRREARQGKDPTARPQAAMSFADAAKKVHALRKHAWSNGKHVDQWINTIKHANPKIGRKDVGEIEAADVSAVLAPIWLTRAATARRLRQRIGVVLDWAQVHGYRDKTMANAADAVSAALPKQTTSKKHHEALPWAEVPKFVKAVRSSKSMEGCRLALEFVTLTAARTGEAVNATWPEFDVEAKLWIVPAKRMKAKKEHRVPLSDQAVAMLTTARERWPNATLVFPGRYGKQLSNMAMLMCMRRLKMGARPTGYAARSATGAPTAAWMTGWRRRRSHTPSAARPSSPTSARTTSSVVGS